MAAMTATSSRRPARNLRRPIFNLKKGAPQHYIACRADSVVLPLATLRGPTIFAAAPVTGGMAEWLKAHAWKACIRATVSWVRIPLPPPTDFSEIRRHPENPIILLR